MIACYPFLLCSVLMLAGCGGGGSSSNSSAPAAPATPLTVSAAIPGGLTATLAESTSSVTVGDNINYTFTLTNNTSQPATFQEISGCGITLTLVGASLNIVNAVGQIVNATESGCGAISAPTNVTLAPGQSVSVTGSSSLGGTEPFASAGVYYATATFAYAPSATEPLQTTSIGPLRVTAS